MASPDCLPKVLIVEDDEALRRGLRDNFAGAGYVVDTAAEGDGGLARAMEGNPDLVVLDVMLPGLNGFEICREMRRAGCRVPVIMLTAKSEESDLLLGLGIGADDYVTKPFRIRELLARAEAVLRRHGEWSGGEGSRADETLAFGGFVLDMRARELRDAGGAVVPLSPKEFALLEYFARRPGRALGREQIMNAVWGYGALVTLRSIDRFVTTLRRKIEREPARPRHLVTIREFGYRFEPDPDGAA